MKVDVVVLGTGPAGSATALRLARQGWQVVLIGRVGQHYKRPAETLAPANQALFRELGLWDRFLALEPTECLGTESLWGSPAPREHSHFLNPYGAGWHVDREHLDAMLVESAMAAGAIKITGRVGLVECRFLANWKLTVRRAGSTATTILDAKFLVDATGRRAQLARHLGSVRLEFDRLVGIGMDWAFVGSRSGEPLVIESAPEGWWYAVPASSRGTMSTILMTDADLAGDLRRSPALLAALDRTTSIKSLVSSGRAQPGPSVHDARSHRLRRPDLAAPEPWIAVGDSSLAVDPVSGSGFWRSLSMAAAGARAVDAALRDQGSLRDAVNTYEDDRDDECTRYLEERAGYYDAEQRFATSFWKRRNVLRPGAVSSH